MTFALLQVAEEPADEEELMNVQEQLLSISKEIMEIKGEGDGPMSSVLSAVREKLTAGHKLTLKEKRLIREADGAGCFVGDAGLEEKQEEESGEVLRSHELFDLIGGTSTGGLFALAIGIRGVSVSDLLDIWNKPAKLFCRHSNSVFFKGEYKPKNLVGGAHLGALGTLFMYESKNMEEILRDYFEGEMMDCKKWLGKHTPAVFVTAHLLDVDPLTPFLIRNYGRPCNPVSFVPILVTHRMIHRGSFQSCQTSHWPGLRMSRRPWGTGGSPAWRLAERPQPPQPTSSRSASGVGVRTPSRSTSAGRFARTHRTSGWTRRWPVPGLTRAHSDSLRPNAARLCGRRGRPRQPGWMSALRRCGRRCRPANPLAPSACRHLPKCETVSAERQWTDWLGAGGGRRGGCCPWGRVAANH